MKYGLVFIISFFLSDCGQGFSQADEQENGKPPSCKIVYLDSYYTGFLKGVRVDPYNWDKIYSEKVKDAIFKDYFSRSEYSDLILESFSYVIHDTSGMTKFIADLNSNKQEVESIISSAFMRCNEELKNNNVVFYLAPSSSDTEEILNKMGGVTGQTAGSKQILITIDFNVASWKEVLEYTVAHEFNHAYSTNTNRSYILNFNLLKYLVFEGKADSFAHLLYPKAKAPWTFSLSDKEKTDLWRAIKPKLQSDDPVLLGEIMFGSKNYPTWGGYTLGYDIIQTALKNHPELLKTNWTNLDAEKLLKLSDYN